MKKTIVISLLMAVFMLGQAGMSPAQAKKAPPKSVKCSATGGISIGVINSNTLYAGQTIISSNSTGDNKVNGNIGDNNSVQSGTASSSATQTITGNTNSTTVDLSGQTGATNTTTVNNTGNNVSVCTAASN